MAVINPRLIISAVTEDRWNARLDAWLMADVFIGLSLFCGLTALSHQWRFAR
jgi:hypothetical protein